MRKEQGRTPWARPENMLKDKDFIGELHMTTTDSYTTCHQTDDTEESRLENLHLHLGRNL